MLWEHKEHVFFISFKKYCNEKKRIVYLDNQNVNSLHLSHHYVTSTC